MPLFICLFVRSIEETKIEFENTFRWARFSVFLAPMKLLNISNDVSGSINSLFDGFFRLGETSYLFEDFNINFSTVQHPILAV